MQKTSLQIFFDVLLLRLNLGMFFVPGLGRNKRNRRFKKQGIHFKNPPFRRIFSFL